MDGEGQTFTVFNRDLPDALHPTTVVAFFGDSLMILAISKHFLGSMDEAWSRSQARRPPEPFLSHLLWVFLY